MLTRSSIAPQLGLTLRRVYISDFRARKCVCACIPTVALLRPRTEQQCVRPFGSCKIVWSSHWHSLEIAARTDLGETRTTGGTFLPRVHARFNRQIKTYIELLVKGLRPASYARRLARKPACFADRHCSSGTVRGASRRERLAL